MQSYTSYIRLVVRMHKPLYPRLCSRHDNVQPKRTIRNHAYSSKIHASNIQCMSISNQYCLCSKNPNIDTQRRSQRNWTAVIVTEIADKNMGDQEYSRISPCKTRKKTFDCCSINQAKKIPQNQTIMFPQIGIIPPNLQSSKILGVEILSFSTCLRQYENSMTTTSINADPSLILGRWYEHIHGESCISSARDNGHVNAQSILDRLQTPKYHLNK